MLEGFYSPLDRIVIGDGDRMQTESQRTHSTLSGSSNDSMAVQDSTSSESRQY